MNLSTTQGEISVKTDNFNLTGDIPSENLRPNRSCSCRLKKSTSTEVQKASKNQNLMKLKQKKDQQTDLYALALLLAEAQSRDQQDRQTNFINNLSRICDQFATGRKK